MAGKLLVHLCVILSVLGLLDAATQHRICSSYNGKWPPSAKYKMGGCYVLKLRGSVEKCVIYGGLIRMVEMPKEEGAKCMMSPRERTMHCLCPTASGLLSSDEYRNCKDSALMELMGIMKYLQMKAYNDKNISCTMRITAEERVTVAIKPPTTAVKLPSTFKPLRLSSTLSGYSNESQVIVTDSAKVQNAALLI
ncbi:hypothetical protein TELCIR_06419 [Teladorsagia circumcincta]|uniref:Uncharacterized protein n=1 Tax=Teladorsagia circumcincta TaxID=45464 RepID=A0A2G9UN33_TELCI|nr:hypothetical protein TELCIR_06419 [Teladorsagia circumcincta]